MFLGCLPKMFPPHGESRGCKCSEHVCRMLMNIEDVPITNSFQKDPAENVFLRKHLFSTTTNIIFRKIPLETIRRARGTFLR